MNPKINHDADDLLLLNSKWKKVRKGSVLRFRDPKTTKLYAKAYALIVQQEYDEAAADKRRQQISLKEAKRLAKLEKWLKTEHTIDELYPAGSVYKGPLK